MTLFSPFVVVSLGETGRVACEMVMEILGGASVVWSPCRFLCCSIVARYEFLRISVRTYSTCTGTYLDR
jgi:hypothetical protein